jgi:hypothetical protein
MKTAELRNLNYTTAPPKSDWEYIMDNSSSANILNSLEYAEALEKQGWRTLKILLYNDSIPVSAMLGKYKPIMGFTKSIILGGLGGGSPVIIDSLNKEQKIEVLINSLKILQKESERNRIFQMKIHVPLFYENLLDIYDKICFKLSTILYTPLIDISSTEEYLWSNLHKKHRNAIRSAMRKGVEIVKVDSFAEFSRLKLGHQKVKKYKDTSLSDLKIIYNTFRRDNMCDLYFSNYEGEYLSGAFIWKYKKTIYYVYGASTEKSWGLQANNLLHWEIIKDAHNNGYKTYNMWGGKLGDNSATQFKIHFSKDAKLVQIKKFKKNVFSIGGIG